MMNNCIICGQKSLDKDTIGINKKMLGKKIKQVYCIACLSEYLECSVQELMDKIEEFKEAGCTEFK